jgi:hypothetical protein
LSLLEARWIAFLAFLEDSLGCYPETHHSSEEFLVESREPDVHNA